MLADNLQFAEDATKPQRVVVGAAALAVVLVPLAWAAELFPAIGLLLFREQFYAAEFALCFVAVFLYVGSNGRRGACATTVDWCLAVAAGMLFGYIALRYPALVNIVYVDRFEPMVLSVAMVAIVVEAARRVLGWPMVALVAAFLAYGLLAEYLPGFVAGPPTKFATYAIYLGLGGDGMLGIAIAVVFAVVIGFIVFGQVFIHAGGGLFVTDLAIALTGGRRGGPAKASIIASGLFGSISGSVVSNVATTGAITIPMMRRTGFSAPAAAGIEAVASTGGQLMPPVMGAAAFLMVEFVGVPYQDILRAAIVPGLLFYFALLVLADQWAGRFGIVTPVADGAPRWYETVRRGFVFMLPLVAVVVAMGPLNLGAGSAALIATLVAFALGFFIGYGGQRLRLADVMSVLQRAGLISINILVMAAAAGIIIGVIGLTGVAVAGGIMLLTLGQEQLFLVLVITAAAALILGMGLATTAIYVVVATILAPSLISLGVAPIAAHLFVFYMGMMCMVTPPIAFAVLAAAGMAGADFLQTVREGIRFGWSALILPFLFVYSPALLLIGDVGTIVFVITKTMAGLWLVSGAMSGYLSGRLRPGWRVLALVAGTGLLYPGAVDAYTIGLAAAGLAVGAAIALKRDMPPVEPLPAKRQAG